MTLPKCKPAPDPGQHVDLRVRTWTHDAVETERYHDRDRSTDMRLRKSPGLAPGEAIKMITNDALITQFRQIVGTAHVLTGQKATERFRKGFRSGSGAALCVVRPGTL